MATQATSSTSSDEILFQNSGVSLCLLVNRRQRSMRIVDFRSGPHPAKRLFVMTLAHREGVERVYTLVERDECSTWTRLGFAREGNIPGFYKRSDAFILGATVPDSVQTDGDDLEESGLRPVLSTKSEPEPDTDRVYQALRKRAKELDEGPTPAVKVQRARPQDVKKALTAALRSRRALTGFEPFGRDVERLSYACTARGGFSLMASVETQPCFDNAYLELLTSPRTDKEVALTLASIRKLCDELFEQGIVGCFAITPVSDQALGAIFVANGFRRTGVLRQHLLLGNERADAFLWSRKLALPADG
jgi:hypothetical protein